MYSIKNRDDLEILYELIVYIKSQVKAVRLQDKLGRHNFLEDMKKVFEPVTDIVKDVTNDITKTITETSIENNIALDKLNEKGLELRNDRRMIAPYFASSLVKVFKRENKSQLVLLKDSNSIRENDFLINTNIPVTLNCNMIIFRDSSKTFKLDGDLLKTMTNYNFNVAHSNPQDQKLIHDFVKEMNF